MEFKDLKLAGFLFNKIIIIQSLEPDEFQTGNHIAQYLRSLLDDLKIKMPIELINCESKIELIPILLAIKNSCIENGDLPIIHIECHGDIDDGLEFSNGSLISWTELAGEFTPINLATKFNLLLIFSACFAGNFLGQMGALAPSPCWCMVAPSEKVDPGEILRGFKVFYKTFFEKHDAGIAVHELSRIKLQFGRFFGEPSELWFEKVVSNYIEDHCTPKAIRKRAFDLIKSGMLLNQNISIAEAKRAIRDQNKKKVFESYFNSYFMIQEIPVNKKRFENVIKRINDKFPKFNLTGVHFKQ